MGQWVGVHSIKQEYRGREEILEEWIPALADGLQWATGRRTRSDLDLSFYGHRFRDADFPGYALSTAYSMAAEGPALRQMESRHATCRLLLAGWTTECVKK